MPQEIGAFLMNTDKQVTITMGIHSGNDVVMNVFPINNDGYFLTTFIEIIEQQLLGLIIYDRHH